MSFGHALYLLLIYPLQLFFEVVFSKAFELVNSYGYAIIILSIVINIIVLPLYLRADRIQKEQRLIEEKLKLGVDHIKKTFKGDERVMMLQTYYRQNNYHPAMMLRSATSLLLQIPFFMAAYNMLSTLRWLNGVPFWFIRDLGQPDAMFTIGTFTVNLLPILMTLLNVVSSAIYTRGSSLREKVQAYGLALIFLVFLYNSPAGLAFYWMLNNLFSLVKNVVTYVVEKFFPNGISKVKSFIEGLLHNIKDSNRQTRVSFLLSASVNASLVSFCAPMSLLNAGVEEFLEPFTYDAPLIYVYDTVLIGLGVFVVWGYIIYSLLSSKGKKIFAILSVGLSIFFCANFFYEPALIEKLSFIPAPITYTVVLILSFVVFAVVFKYSKFIFNVILICTMLGTIILGLIAENMMMDRYSEVNFPPLNENIRVNLSTEGQNVVVIMLDRALGVTVQDEFDMIPGLKERFDGFSYYPNTISYGAHTNFASPALFGGYEYTPYMINQRSDELLKNKQNEALKVMPQIFSSADFDVTFINPVYAGYQFVPDTSIFSDIDNVNAYYVDNYFNDYSISLGNSINATRERDIFFFGICYSMIYGRDFFYDNGNYNNPNRDYYLNQNFEDFGDVNGSIYRTANDYNVLNSLSDITDINSGDRNNLLLLVNELPHGVVTPFVNDVDVEFNLSDYYNQVCALCGDNENLIEAYMSNGISFELLGEWFDYLREQGVYDNTRIIIVSDHGYMNNYLNNCTFPEVYEDKEFGIESYVPILFVKDFNSHGFTIEENFMTNADVVYLASEGLINNPVNPYTGNPITSYIGSDVPLRICYSHRYNTDVNNGTTFLETDSWYTITDTNDIFNINNWRIIGN